MFSFYNSKKEDPSGLKSLPSIFTILGVFGTFTGISLGLYYFDRILMRLQIVFLY